MRCPTCAGCTDDTCSGTCDAPRWCSGTYTDGHCNRCPDKVDKNITDSQGHRRTIQVRCTADTQHTGICHWDQRLAGTQPTTEETNP
jgi:hypothetical protein